MVDVLILLIPLLVLPIVLLLAFVGCDAITGLDQFDIATPIIFRYTGGLHHELEKIEWEFELEDIETVSDGVTGTIGDPPGGPPPPPPLTHYELVDAEIHPNGADQPDGTLTYSQKGRVICHCWVTRIGQEREELEDKEKEKILDEPSPVFNLERSGSDYHVV